MQLVITPVVESEHALVRALYAMYLHDLSEFTDEYRLDESGRWQPDHLGYWLAATAEAHALLLREGGRPVGLACVGAAPFPWMTPGRDFRLAEFFVLRRERRRGVGAAAARAVFDRFRGRWEISELPENRAAIAFWRRVLADYTAGDFVELTLPDGDVVQHFDNRQGATRSVT